MVINEQPSVRAALRQAIEGADIQVVAEAAPGEDVLAVARRERPDVLLIDVEAPDDDDIALVQALSVAAPTAVIVVLTSSHARKELFRAVEAGARGYLVKGLSSSALRRAIRAAVRGELAMPRDLAAEIVARLAGGPSAASPVPRLALLSPRELEVLGLLAKGLTDHEIADILDVSPRTVEAHVGSILRKLGARNRASATRTYLQG
jgi:DNA-binding NarL/FixJ family response regulator